jgi:hypothetical protein
MLLTRSAQQFQKQNELAQHKHKKKKNRGTDVIVVALVIKSKDCSSVHQNVGKLMYK